MGQGREECVEVGGGEEERGAGAREEACAIFEMNEEITTGC